MKKKKILIIPIIFLFALVGIIAWGFFTIQSQKPNNDVAYQQIIDRKYSEKEIDVLKKRFENGNLSLLYFRLRYRPQCIRQWDNHSYAILLGKDDTRVFVLWNSRTEIIYEVYEISSFLEYQDFAGVPIGKTCLDEIKVLDSNFIDTSVKAEMSTGHIVKEGIVNVEYDSQTRIVSGIQFYSNAEICDSLQDAPIIFVPYILPQDKI